MTVLIFSISLVIFCFAQSTVVAETSPGLKEVPLRSCSFDSKSQQFITSGEESPQFRQVSTGQDLLLHFDMEDSASVYDFTLSSREGQKPFEEVVSGRFVPSKEDSQRLLVRFKSNDRPASILNLRLRKIADSQDELEEIEFRRRELTTRMIETLKSLRRVPLSKLETINRRLAMLLNESELLSINEFSRLFSGHLYASYTEVGKFMGLAGHAYLVLKKSDQQCGTSYLEKWTVSDFFGLPFRSNNIYRPQAYSALRFAQQISMTSQSRGERALDACVHASNLDKILKGADLEALIAEGDQIRAPGTNPFERGEVSFSNLSSRGWSSGIHNAYFRFLRDSDDPRATEVLQETPASFFSLVDNAVLIRGIVLDNGDQKSPRANLAPSEWIATTIVKPRMQELEVSSGEAGLEFTGEVMSYGTRKPGWINDLFTFYLYEKLFLSFSRHCGGENVFASLPPVSFTRFNELKAPISNELLEKVEELEANCEMSLPQRASSIEKLLFDQGLLLSQSQTSLQDYESDENVRQAWNSMPLMTEKVRAVLKQMMESSRLQKDKIALLAIITPSVSNQPWDLEAWMKDIERAKFLNFTNAGRILRHSAVPAAHHRFSLYGEEDSAFYLPVSLANLFPYDHANSDVIVAPEDSTQIFCAGLEFSDRDKTSSHSFEVMDRFFQSIATSDTVNEIGTSDTVNESDREGRGGIVLSDPLTDAYPGGSPGSFSQNSVGSDGVGSCSIRSRSDSNPIGLLVLALLMLIYGFRFSSSRRHRLRASASSSFEASGERANENSSC